MYSSFLTPVLAVQQMYLNTCRTVLRIQLKLAPSFHPLLGEPFCVPSWTCRDLQLVDPPWSADPKTDWDQALLTEPNSLIYTKSYKSSKMKRTDTFNTFFVLDHLEIIGMILPWPIYAGLCQESRVLFNETHLGLYFSDIQHFFPIGGKGRNTTGATGRQFRTTEEYTRRTSPHLNTLSSITKRTDRSGALGAPETQIPKLPQQLHQPL